MRKLLLRKLIAPHKGPIVLMYHSLAGDGEESSRWTVRRQEFFEQMRLLEDLGWKSRRVDELPLSFQQDENAFAVTFDDGFANTYGAGFEVLAKLGMRATWFVVTGSVGKQSRWHDDGVPSRAVLGAQQLREMTSAGMEIGAHSRDHLDLTTIRGTLLRDEVGGSREDLEQMLSQPVLSFAYPYGRYGDDAILAVRDAGYKFAVTTNTGFARNAKSAFEIPRVAVFGTDSLSWFARKLAFATTDVSWRSLAGNRLRGWVS